MRIFCIIFLYFCVNSFTFSFEEAKGIKVVTDNFPPYNYIDDKGELVGSATKIVQDTLNMAGVEYQISIYPWARSYATVKSSKNHMIYSMTRTPQREKAFIWIGPVTRSIKVWFFKRKGDRRFSSRPIKEVKDILKYKVAVQRSTSYFKFLESNKFTKIFKVNEQELALKMLKKGRVDLVFMPGITFYNILKFQKSQGQFGNINKDDFDKVFTPWTISEWMAMNKESDLDLVGKVKSAYEQLKREERINLE